MVPSVLSSILFRTSPQLKSFVAIALMTAVVSDVTAELSVEAVTAVP